MIKSEVTLVPIEPSDRNQFILDNQEAFRYSALEEFGLRDNHFEEEGEIISRKTIERALDCSNGETYRIVYNGKNVGGLVLIINKLEYKGDLQLLFISPQYHSRGIGYAAWCEVEKLYPEIRLWETMTPYFETRNIHFYVNRCKFQIVEYFNSHHPFPEHYEEGTNNDGDNNNMFRFEKKILIRGC